MQEAAAATEPPQRSGAAWIRMTRAAMGMMRTAPSITRAASIGMTGVSGTGTRRGMTDETALVAAIAAGESDMMLPSTRTVTRSRQKGIAAV